MSQLILKLWPKIHDSMSIQQPFFLATILNNGNSWNFWTCQHHLKCIFYVHKYAIKSKNHDIMIIISIIMTINGFLQQYLAAILENGKVLLELLRLSRPSWIRRANKLIFKLKNHDHNTIISKIMANNSWFYVYYFEVIAKNCLLQPFWATILDDGDSCNCKLDSTILNGFVMSINMDKDPKIMILW